jgi:DnaJ-class molecular chaperone
MQFSQESKLRKAKDSVKAERRAAKADFADRIASLQRDAEDERNQRVDWALAILGASRSTHASELKALYRYMVRKTHPDGRVASPDSVDALEPDSHEPSFEVVQQAWEVLVSSGRVSK